MYWEYFELEENPFSISPDPRYLYMSKRHQEALAHLVYGVSEGGSFVLLTGEVGTGKTTVCRCLIEELPDSVELAFILNPRVDEVELLATICDEFAIPTPRHGPTLKLLVDRLNERLLEAHARGRRAVLMIDEAQNLSPAVLEQVRLLTNLETTTQKLLQIVLVGQPELNDLLKRKGLRQLDQRITARYHLEPLSRRETAGYIAHRVGVAGVTHEIFTSAAVHTIYRRSGGTPRLINTICDRCLLGAYAEDRQRVGTRLVRGAASEVLGVQARRRGAPRWLAGAAAGAVVVAAVVADPLGLGLPARLGYGPPAHEVAAVAPFAVQDDAVSRPPPAAEAPEAAQPASPEPATLRPEDRGDEPPALLPPPPPPVGEPEASGRDGAAASDSVAENVTPADPAGTEVFEAALFAAAEPVAPPAPPAAPSPTVVAPTEESPVGPPIDRGPPSAAVDGEPAAAEAPPMEVAALAAPLPVAETTDRPAEGPSVLADLLERPGTLGDMEAALTSLFRRWGFDYGQLGGVTPCRKARYANLRCLQGRTTWHELRLADRSAVIALRVPDGRRVHAALVHLGDDDAVLEIDGREMETTVAELSPLWSGDFLLLWRPPPLFVREMREGHDGEDVAWLAELHGETPGQTQNTLFDAALLDRLRSFQRDRGLLVDGIAGPRTIIQINTSAGVPDLPTLH
jgi:general secretion pathway protein A